MSAGRASIHLESAVSPKLPPKRIAGINPATFNPLAWKIELGPVADQARQPPGFPLGRSAFFQGVRVPVSPTVFSACLQAESTARP